MARLPSPSVSIIILSDSLSPHCESVVIEPVKEGVDATARVIVFFDRVEIRSYNRSVLTEFLKQTRIIDIKAQGLCCAM